MTDTHTRIAELVAAIETSPSIWLRIEAESMLSRELRNAIPEILAALHSAKKVEGINTSQHITFDIVDRAAQAVKEAVANYPPHVKDPVCALSHVIARAAIEATKESIDE